MLYLKYSNGCLLPAAESGHHAERMSLLAAYDDAGVNRGCTPLLWFNYLSMITTLAKN